MNHPPSAVIPLFPVRATIALFTLALLVRLAFVLVIWQRSGSLLQFPDEALHWQLASNLADRKLLISDDGRYAARMPAYPLLLWPCAEWEGEPGPAGDHLIARPVSTEQPAHSRDPGILLARLLQCLMGAATAGVAVWWAAAAAGRAAGIIAGLLVALDPFNIFFCNLLLTEVPYTFVTLLWAALVWRIARAPTDQPAGLLLLAALLGPLGVMLRPSAAAWLAAIIVLSPLLFISPRRGLYFSLLSVLATLALFLPWGARNHVVLGDFAWLSANGGWTLYDAQGPQADGSSRQQDFVNDVPELAPLGELEQDALLRQKAIEQMRHDPARVLRLAAKRFVRTWNPIPNVAEYRRPIIAWVSAAYTAPILIAAVLSLRRLRADATLFVLLWLPVVLFTLIHMVYVGSVRYRVPLMPFLAIAAAIAFSRRAR